MCHESCNIFYRQDCSTKKIVVPTISTSAMGCCASKVPSFEKAAASLANDVMPKSAPNSEFQLIKLVPNQGLFSAAVAVYLPSDGDVSPSYFFNGAMGSFKLFKIVTATGGETDSQEVATIDGGWQSSKGDGYTENHSFNDGSQNTHQITKRAEKTCTVKSNNVQVKIKKLYVRGDGTKVEIDSGFEITEDSSGCQILSRNGRIVAYIYEKRKEDAVENMTPGIGTSMAVGMSYFKGPVGLFVANMPEDDLQLTLSVIATANDRLIRSAMLEIYG